MASFAGYEMPINYPLGIKKEHIHTRNEASLFDVSHMGQISLKGEGAKAALESLVPVDIIDLPLMKLRYAFFTNKDGGVIDDLMVTNLGDQGLLLVVNAACKENDLHHLKEMIGSDCNVDFIEDVALLALQGPKAVEVLAEYDHSISKMMFMTAKYSFINGTNCLVTRSGYTGEDGFEISLPSQDVENFCKLLLSHDTVNWAGLGARDSLRLEAGLSLYGHELDIENTPVESSLNWALSKVRRSGGYRQGGYLGQEVIMSHLNEEPDSKIVGLQPEGKIPVRDGAVIEDDSGNKVGIVTSGGFGPSVNRPVAIGRVQKQYTDNQSKLFALVRSKKIAVKVVKLPFVKHNYFKG